MLAKPEPTVSTLSAWTYRVTVKAACVARGTRGVGGAVRHWLHASVRGVSDIVNIARFGSRNTARPSVPTPLLAASTGALFALRSTPP